MYRDISDALIHVNVTPDPRGFPYKPRKAYHLLLVPLFNFVTFTFCFSKHLTFLSLPLSLSF